MSSLSISRDALAIKIHDMLASVELLRLDASRQLEPQRKVALGQFFTVQPIATLMASMLEYRGPTLSLLEPCAGTGVLFAACIAELCQRPERPSAIHVTAFEIDSFLQPYLTQTMKYCKILCASVGISFTGEIIIADFIEEFAGQNVSSLFSPLSRSVNCIILNPPYQKIQAGSKHWKLLHHNGITATNLYSSFLALCMDILEPHGEMVAIVPRSFCNGPYFKPFRESLLRTVSLNKIHLFETREYAFSQDDVLQETVVLAITKTPNQAPSVLITGTTSVSDSMISERAVPYGQVVISSDPQSFIRIVHDKVGERITEKMQLFTTHLEDLGIAVSTGKVVDFRATTFLRHLPEEGTVPLIYPGHLSSGRVVWPKLEAKKPNAIFAIEESRTLLVPNECYVLVRRFSAKEEKKRVVAALYEADTLPGTHVGFENHLNYFHHNQRGLDPSLAKGLSVYLNSTFVDMYVRSFNGHTQVNATDLRSISYPTLCQLQTLGELLGDNEQTQDMIDIAVEKVLFPMTNNQETNPILIEKRIEEAKNILHELGFPRQQQNVRSALTLLALLDLKPTTSWSEAKSTLLGITQMMNFFAEQYAKTYAPNSRETVRRQTIHQFVEAGLAIQNPDKSRPTNSGLTVYSIEPVVLKLLQTYGTLEWETQIADYLIEVGTLKKRYARERESMRIPLQIAEGKTITLSPGGQNVLVELIIREFAPVFIAGGKLLYVGDTDEKYAYFDEEGLSSLGVILETRGKIPDVIIYNTVKNWLVLIEAVTSHGPISPKRHNELKQIFQQTSAGLVFVTAFLSKKALKQYLTELAWETDVWIAEDPTHLIHLNGTRFLGPYTH